MAVPVVDLVPFLGRKPEQISKGPLAVILIEDDAAATETVAHHLARGFRHILVLSDRPCPLPDAMEAKVTNLIFPVRGADSHVTAVNAVIAAVPAGTWLYYCFNAEFLFYPFSETRTVGELLAFHTEERRAAMLTYVVDLYPADPAARPGAVDLEAPLFDRTGYYALARHSTDGQPLDRQLDFHGGLRWRYEELLPPDRRRIDRIALFRAQEGLRLLADHRFTDEEYNTYSCPWHHNLTASIASFRVAKALVSNPGSRDQVGDMVWRNSQAFRWDSQQLMDLGLMEPGQWF